MAGILRGEIHWADLNPFRGREQAGLRPVNWLAISSEKANFPLFAQLTNLVLIF